ncbi:MAG TPA: hypothetical protein VL200_00135 [Lacunisphaera sp.]|jgi:hypothetical protein|nr:hypothetical protein [Lacunisphaera sp.]
MKFKTCLLFGLLGAAAVPLAAQLPVPNPVPANPEAPVILDDSAPLRSLEAQLESASFEQRGTFEPAFDQADRTITERVTELRAQGLDPADNAEVNLENARDHARQVFRYLSLASSETWTTARHNAVLALRTLRGAFDQLEHTAAVPR